MKKILSIFTVLFLLSACGKDDENETAPDIDDTPSAKSSDDYRGLMRDFVTSISKKGKAAIPGFAVIPQNGIQLVATGDEPDTPLAEQYLAAIDGHGQEDIFYGSPSDNHATSKSDTEWLRAYLDRLKAKGNVILCTDYCSSEEKMKDSRKKNAEAGYLSYQAIERNLNVIPNYNPENENSNDIKSLKDAKNFLYILELSAFASKDAFISAVCNTNFDVLITDLFFYDDNAFSAEEVERMRQKKNGGKRMVVCYMSIGEAEDYRFYWQNDWKKNPPEFLDKENPDWDGNFKVKYWISSWQDIILNQYLTKIFEARYDGVYLDIIDAFEYYEDGE